MILMQDFIKIPEKFAMRSIVLPEKTTTTNTTKTEVRRFFCDIKSYNIERHYI